MEEREQLKQAIAAQEVLRGTLPDEVVEATIGALREKLVALEMAEKPQQRKQATILFADVAGFTAMSETLDAEIVTGIMNDLWAQLDAAIVGQGGHIDKHIGDAVMALWGVDTTREDDPERAVRAALAMQEALASFHASAGEAGKELELSMRIGINTGPVLLGQVGSRHEFTAMGDAVNLASRLEHAAPAAGILISYDTYSHVRGLFDVEELEPIQVKGKLEPVQVCIVKRAREHDFHMATRGVEGVETRMIGRDAELLALQNTFHDVVEGAETRVMTIVGEAGVGKSRLLFEFDHWVERQREPVTILKGRGMPSTQRVANSLFRDLFALHFGVSELDNRAVALEKFHVGTAGILEAAQADVLGHWLGFDFSSSQAVDNVLGSEEFSILAQGYLMDFMNALVTTAPIVIFLEDLHWADEGSLDLVVRLARSIGESRAGGERLLIVGMTRPIFFEHRPLWGEGLANFRRIPLAPLSRRASGALVDEILQRVQDIPNSLRDFVVESAEGNPFYVEELVKTLIDQGVIVRDDPTWRVLPDRLAETNVPSTLTGLLQARLDVLPEPERETLQRAAVIGRLFWNTAVSELAEADVGKIRSLLGEIRGRELIFQREHSSFADADEYIFKHALLRDVAYDTVLLMERRVYHHRAAQWLEANAGERQKEYLEQIAAHYVLAEEKEKALPYLIQAGDEARFRNAFAEAARYYEEALEIYKSSEDYESAVRVLMKLGLTYHNAFDYERARQAYDEGFALQQQIQTAPSTIQLSAAPHPLRVIAPPPPSTLDPTRTNEGEMINFLFSGLVRLTPEMDLMPELAASWRIENDGKTYIFQLRDDVQWSDGQPVTADDFVYAWRRALDPRHGSPMATILYDIQGAAPQQGGGQWDPEKVGVSAPDVYTLRVDLEQPASYFLQVLTHGVAMPVPRHVVDVHGEAWTEGANFVNNGRYLLESWRRGDSLVLRRNPTYHGSFKGNVRGIEFRFGRKFETVMPLYDADQVDILNIWDFAAEELDRATRQYADDYKNLASALTGFIAFNINEPPFDDARVRRAFVLAADRQDVVDRHELGRAFAATGGFVPPGMPGHVPDIALPYDIDAARQLLAEAGYPEGQGLPPLRALVAPWDEVRIPEFALKPWESTLGVQIEWEIAPWDVYRERVREERAHFYAFGWDSVYRDPDGYLRMGILHISDWRDATYFNLVERARGITDHEERMRLYRKAEEILRDEAPIMPMLYLRGNFLIKPWIRNYPLRGDLHYAEWYDTLIIDPH